MLIAMISSQASFLMRKQQKALAVKQKALAMMRDGHIVFCDWQVIDASPSGNEDAVNSARESLLSASMSHPNVVSTRMSHY